VSALLEIEVERDGQDTVRVPVKMRTVLAWEKAFRGRAMALLSAEAMKAEYVYELAWLASDKPGTFDEFCASTDVTPVADEPQDGGAADPTNPGPSTGP
jgi:hypothetical protein